MLTPILVYTSYLIYICSVYMCVRIRICRNYRSLLQKSPIKETLFCKVYAYVDAPWTLSHFLSLMYVYPYFSVHVVYFPRIYAGNVLHVHVYAYVDAPWTLSHFLSLMYVYPYFSVHIVYFPRIYVCAHLDM